MTARRIYLLRHAKSDWGDASLDDHDRTLNRRGRRSAAEIPQTLEREAIRPDLVLVSTARRAVETVEFLADDLTGRKERRLYNATANDLLEVLRGLPEDVAEVLLVGHNPGMEDLADLLGQPDGGMSTATLLAFESDVANWAELNPGTAKAAGRWEHRGGKD